MTSALIYSDEYKKHNTDKHPENYHRLEVIIEALYQSGLWEKLEHISPRYATQEEILYVHTIEYIEKVKTLCENGAKGLDLDTIISKESYDIALLAAGGVLTALDGIMKGNYTNAFVAVRPPGHHAEANKGMGFCIFNNIAIGAKYAQNKYNLERIAIIDWDVHHGNGTQEAFYEDPNVLYISLHQYPFYPGSGVKSQIGHNAGEGTTLNIPLPAYSNDDDYAIAFETLVIPALNVFEPQLLLISAGFDAHQSDPLAMMKLTTEGFIQMTHSLKDIAEKYAEGRLVSVLEGGYNLIELPICVREHIKILL